MAWAGAQENNKNKKLLRQVRILRKVGNKSTKIDGEMKKMKKYLHRKMLRTCGRGAPGSPNSLSGYFWSGKWIFLFAALMAPEYAYPDPPDFTTDNLIGSTIFAQSETRTGSLRGWHERGGTSLGYSELGLGLSEYYRDGQVIFIITKTDSKLNQTIQ